MQEDPYAAFKTAFEEQRCELQRLYARVSKLEEVNNDVLTFVKQTGNLPGLKSDGTVHEPCQCTFKDNELGLENITASSSICHKTDTLRGTHLNEPTVPDEDTAALISDTSTKSGCTRADTSQATVITDIIKQQTTELNKALQNLGLEPSKRTQLLDQVQTNLSSILSTQLSRHGPTLTVQPVPESHDFIAGASGGGSSASRSALPIDSPLHSSLGCSFGEGTLSALCPASTDCSHEVIDFQSTSQGVAHLLDIPESVTPVYQSGVTASPTTVNVQQRRRREELLRLNQRMLRPSSGSKAATIHVDVPCDYMQASHLKTPTPGSTWSTLPTPLPRTKCVITHVPCAEDEILTHPVSTLQQLTALSSYGTVVPMNVKEKLVATEHFCPCGDRMHCPLSPAKQQRLASDPRVIRGFTLVVAFFRGHFVRQLLATHKVCDLIRTVKDTAKLALSMHVERQMSSSKFSDSVHADPQTNGGLSNEELVLEMRLLAQLRGALAQLHDIFFSWSLRNQIELMHISRSLPQRNKRAKARSIREEARYMENQSSEVSNETWVHRGALEPRRRWNSSASQWIPRDPNEWPVKMMRRVPEKSECSGSSKLTKLIDSVRRSWPTNRPVGQKKNEPFPIANLTALAYGDSPVDVKQMSNKKPAIKRPLRRSHSSSGGSNNRQPSTEGSNTAQPPIHTRQSLENTSLEPLTYTPVRLYTPPSPNTLTLESTVPADTEMRMPLHQTAPPLQLGQSSLFRVRQLSQNLRAERRQHHELQSADKLILPCSHASRSQQRHPQLQRRDALLYHRSGSGLRLNRSNSPACQLGQDLSRRKLLQAAERTLGSNNHHTLRPPMKRHALRKGERSMSTLNLNGHWVRCKKGQMYRSTPVLIYRTPSPVPYWRRVLFRWHTQSPKEHIACVGQVVIPTVQDTSLAVNDLFPVP